MTKEQTEAFLVELTELTKKHRIMIHGCGCCGSPSLYPVDANDEQGSYTYETKEYPELKWRVAK